MGFGLVGVGWGMLGVSFADFGWGAKGIVLGFGKGGFGECNGMFGPLEEGIFIVEGMGGADYLQDGVSWVCLEAI